jgi:phosphate ABC transporter permease protein PstC
MTQLLLTERQRAWRGVKSAVCRAALFTVTAIAAVAVLAILVFVARDALPFFQARGLKEFFLSTVWNPTGTPAHFGAATLFAGSFLVTAAAVVFAVPPAILAAFCLSDMLPFKLRQVLKPVIEMLAAIPSVVYGFFALAILAPFLQSLGADSGANALNASIVLGVMALPTIVSVSEDALQAAGRELREGSYALGATRAETLVKVILPASISGIFSAILLGVMRALGETMVVWMASGNAAQIPHPWYNLMQPVRTLTATIAGDMGEADQMTGSAHYHALFAMGLSLLVISFLCNLAGEAIVRHQMKIRS